MGVLNILRELTEEGPEAMKTLQRLIERLRGQSPKDFERNADTVGEAYLGAARGRPDFYIAGSKFASDEEGLGRQFKTTYSGAQPTAMGEIVSRAALKPDGSKYHGALDEGRRYWNNLGDFDKSRIGDLFRTAKLGSANGKEFREFDTVMLDQGSGAGQQLYGAAYGSLGNTGDAYNFSSALTPVNAARRSFNMASAIGRNPRLADQLLINRAQLTETPLKTYDYHQLPERKKVGALQLAGHTRMLSDIGSSLSEAARTLKGGKNPNARFLESTVDTVPLDQRALDLARSVNRVGREGAWDADLAALHELRRALRRTQGVGVMPSMGDKTVRRLALSLRALDGQPIDDLTRGLEYRRGGRV